GADDNLWCRLPACLRGLQAGSLHHNGRRARLRAGFLDRQLLGRLRGLDRVLRVAGIDDLETVPGVFEDFFSTRRSGSEDDFGKVGHGECMLGKRGWPGPKGRVPEGHKNPATLSRSVTPRVRTSNFQCETARLRCRILVRFAHPALWAGPPSLATILVL